MDNQLPRLGYRGRYLYQKTTRRFEMIALFICVILCQDANSEFTLGNLISLEQLENGTDVERIKQLEDALNKVPNYKFIPTPEEFRIVAAGLRHENQIVRAGSAALLERLSKKTAADVATQMTRERYGQFSKSKANDEAWDKSVHFLGHRPEIRGPDAYIAWDKYCTGRRSVARILITESIHNYFTSHWSWRPIWIHRTSRLSISQ